VCWATVRATVETPEKRDGLPQRDGNDDRKCVGERCRQAPPHYMHIDAPASFSQPAIFVMHAETKTRKPCCRKKNARCRNCSFRFKVRLPHRDFTDRHANVVRSSGKDIWICGLRMNAAKCKIVVSNCWKAWTLVTAECTEIEVVEDFCYLGSHRPIEQWKL